MLEAKTKAAWPSSAGREIPAARAAWQSSAEDPIAQAKAAPPSSAEGAIQEAKAGKLKAANQVGTLAFDGVGRKAGAIRRLCYFFVTVK
jgi:hypothetical protein